MPPAEETITLTLPARHAEILRSLSEETEVPISQVAAQAIAMLHAVHIGTWHIVSNPQEAIAAARLMDTPEED